MDPANQQSETGRDAPPRAAAMLEALRGLGYSTASALADVIDNSVAAGARSVDVGFHWDGAQSAVTILDNGRGMDAIELDRAMRLGAVSPLTVRASDDLGRFGLGLKTASFSQCRRLTVASIKDSVCNCLRWDLDALAANEKLGWRLFEGPAGGSDRLIAPLVSQNRGTIVVWEVVDRIVTEGCDQQDFLDLVDRVERHLSMVFHRFLTGVKPLLKLSINGRSIPPWDPFLISDTATWTSPIERLVSIDGHVVEVQCHVLPHRDRLNPQSHESAAGPDGWTAQQGFYVYRNQRLLVAGSWLGLGRGRSWTKEEAHRLARIRLDIPNSADSAWKIDIRKSTASPPVSIRERLTLLAEDTRARARRVFAHRGQVVGLGGAPVSQAWRAEHGHSGVRYRLDQDHYAIKAVLENAGTLEPEIRAMLRVIEETVPVQRIWLDTAEARETPRVGFAGQPPAAVSEVLAVLYRNLILRKGLSPVEAQAQLVRMDPFHNYPELVADLPRRDGDREREER